VTAKKALRLSVSEYFFKLSTESVRLYSNKILDFSSFEEVINSRAERANDLADSYDADDLREHLRIIPSDGDVVVSFAILETSATTLEKAASILAEVLGQNIALKDALSLVMFDLVIERNATELLTKLGLTAEEADAYRVHLKRKNTNVIPFPPDRT
jgi:hypothetical protein